MVCAFLFVLQRSWGSNRWTDFDDLYLKTRVSATVPFLWGLEQRYHNFRGSKSSQTAKNWPE